MGYCTDLTDKQWQVIENLLDDKERKRKHSLRSIFNGIFYLVKTACQWRMFPKDFAPWNTFHYLWVCLSAGNPIKAAPSACRLSRNSMGSISWRSLLVLPLTK